MCELMTNVYAIFRLAKVFRIVLVQTIEIVLYTVLA